MLKLVTNQLQEVFNLGVVKNSLSESWELEFISIQHLMNNWVVAVSGFLQQKCLVLECHKVVSGLISFF